MIVLSNGKKIFPEEIEAKLNKIEGVKESIIFENCNKINAKIVYDVKLFSGKTKDEIYNTILENIKKENESLPLYKKINDIIVTAEELERTATGKIKRNIEYGNIKNNNIEKNVEKHENYEKIRNILISKLGNKEINEESNIILDLGADSLDLVEIFLLLEKEFGIKIEKEQRRGMREVKDLMNMVNKSIKLKY